MKNKRSFAYVIWAAVGSMTAIAAVMALLSFQSMRRLHDDFAALREHVLGFQEQLQRVKMGIQDARRGEKDMLLRMANPAAVKKARAAHEQGVQETLQAIGKASTLALDPKDGAVIGDTAKIVKGYGEGMQAIIARLEAGAFKTSGEADAVVSPVAQPLRDVEHKVDAAGVTADKQLAAQMAEFDALLVRQQRLTLGLLAGIVLVGIGAATFLARAVRRPLQQSVQALDAIAAGDLTADVRTDRNDEFGDMLRALAAMTTKLRGLVAGVTHGVDAVGTASHEIAQGSQDLSNRTEEQASSLQQTAASMEQIATTVKQNAETAAQASRLAHSAFDVAERGGTVFAHVVSRMGEITASSRKIEEIIAVIDGIAFQTNILALNAAVEAARAGEQGRGFAVVAGEVRGLAQRSAQAAREIKGLITDSVQKVESGSTLVNEAGETMSEIVAQVRRVTDLIGEITSATTEQTSGIGQVNQAVTQLDQMTQQNAALVEQSAAAAQSLKEQAGRLADSVATFKVSREAAYA